MSVDYLAALPPELIALLALPLSISDLNALAQSSQRLHEILQPVLDARLMPVIARRALFWAAEANKLHIVQKLLSPPHSINPNEGYGWTSKTPLHAAAKGRNIEIAALLLEAGADPAAEWDQDCYQPLHLATLNKDLAMMELLLDAGTPIDADFGCDGCSENVLHLACSSGNMEMVRLLLDRGASLTRTGHYGPALGFAVHRWKLDVVRLLLEKDADATVTVPLYVLLEGGPPLPHEASLLYIALALCPPSRPGERIRWHAKAIKERGNYGPEGWKGVPLREEQRHLMAMLLAHGARKEDAMATIKRHLKALADQVSRTEEEFLEIVEGMFREAEDPELTSVAY